MLTSLLLALDVCLSDAFA
ncbi:DUF645 family protein [Vibrio cholerae]|nr:DUF645 family protein [Vibrio cholerae]